MEAAESGDRQMELRSYSHTLTIPSVEACQALQKQQIERISGGLLVMGWTGSYGFLPSCPDDFSRSGLLHCCESSRCAISLDLRAGKTLCGVELLLIGLRLNPGLHAGRQERTV